MLCVCHGEPLRWHARAALKAGGYWECRVKHRESTRRADELNPEAKRKRQGVYWHKADGGYIRRRRRQLHAQREQVRGLLLELEQEAAVVALSRYPE